MKLGCCINIDAVLNGNAKKIMDSGYSYVELPLTAVAKLSDDDYVQLKNTVKADGLKVDALNLFLPGDIKLTGDKTDMDAFSEYLDTALFRAAELGAEILVFGSGRSRNVPEGFSYEKAWAQLTEILRIASDKAGAYSGLTIVVEPLNKKECNIVNTVTDGYKLAKEVDRENIKLLADYFHMAVDGEPVDNIVKCGDIIRHTHFADPDGRVFPNKIKDEFVQFFGALKKINYTGRVSMECSSKDLVSDTAMAYNVLKDYFS